MIKLSFRHLSISLLSSIALGAKLEKNYQHRLPNYKQTISVAESEIMIDSVVLLNNGWLKFTLAPVAGVSACYYNGNDWFTRKA